MKNELYEKLVKSNDAYHEAVNGLFSDADLTPDQKAQIGTNAHNIFELMNQLRLKCYTMYYPDKKSEKGNA